MVQEGGVHGRVVCSVQVQWWLDLQCTVRCVRVCAKKSSLGLPCVGAVWYLSSLVCGLFLLGPTDLPFLRSLKRQYRNKTFQFQLLELDFALYTYTLHLTFGWLVGRRRT